MDTRIYTNINTQSLHNEIDLPYSIKKINNKRTILDACINYTEKIPWN